MLTQAVNDTILYVDDDHANLVVFEAAMRRHFTVITAPDGAKALEILASRDVAVLLSDQRMPGMTGVELLARARTEFPDPVRILVTAYSNLDEAIAGINQGDIRRYVRKPWNLDELRATLRDAIEVFNTRRDLATMERQLVEAERVYALGVVAAGIEHELRNPMTALTLNADMALTEIATVVDTLPIGATEKTRATAASLQHRLATIRRLTSSLRDILDGMSLSNRRKDSQQSTDLLEVVRLTATSLRGTMQRRALTKLSLQPVPLVCGSTPQLGQVVLNLLVNAVQALPLDPKKRDHQVSVRLTQDGDFAKLEVEDTGPGIAPDVTRHIFDPFFTTKSDGGTGLGLAITKKIVDELGGTITVESTIGSGSCFTVRIPLAEPATESD